MANSKGKASKENHLLHQHAHITNQNWAPKFIVNYESLLLNVIVIHYLSNSDNIKKRSK